MRRGGKSVLKNKTLIIGLICGALCALFVGLYIAQVDERANAAQADMLAKYGGDQIEVCVARRDISAGETIADSDIETKMWIATLLPSNAVTAKSDAVGKQVGSAILAGEVISASRFGLDASSIDVPDGFTAISVPARDVQAVGGALKAGMRVDVYAVGASSTEKIGSSVLVLESFLSDSGTTNSNAWITLAVEPSQVQELVSSASNLDLYFTLPSSSVANSEREGSFSSGSKSSANGSSAASSSSYSYTDAGTSASGKSQDGSQRDMGGTNPNMASSRSGNSEKEGDHRNE